MISSIVNTLVVLAALIPAYKNPKLPVEERVNDLLGRMTLEEKVMQLSQSYMERNDNTNNIAKQLDRTPAEIGSMINYGWDASVTNALQKRAMEESRLGIPIIFGYDAIHGFRTEFPLPLAQAASFNTDMARESCKVIAAEGYAGGIDWTFSPMIDIARDARWGRNAEGYGEDPYLTSRFCVAAVEGYQGDDMSKPGHLASCMKHYTGYGASEAGRDYTAVDISRQTLWDTWLQPYIAGVKAGSASVMSAFCTLSGIPASADPYILKEALKKKMNFDGFIVTDWGTTEQLMLQGYASSEKEAAKMALNAGIDMDMCDMVFYRNLKALVESGEVSMADVDDAVRRILRVKFRLGLFEHPYRPKTNPKKDYLQPASLELAEKLASECAVLLKNNAGALPLSKKAKVALIGPLADAAEEYLGCWKAHGFPEDLTSIYAAMSKEFSNVQYEKGCDFEGEDRSGFPKAVKLAGESDVVVLCIGEKAVWTGENKTRASIALPRIQEDLLCELKKTGKPVVVLVGSGRAIDLVRIEPMADALMEIWHLGDREGEAVSGLLCGRYNPSGKLPVTFPYTTGQVPIYYNARNICRRGKWGKYTDGTPLEPKYPFGYGLSYSSFEYSPIELDGLTAKVRVTNTSAVDGKESVLWFITDSYCSRVARPVKELKYFEKRLIKAGTTEVFTFELDKLRDLGFIDGNGERFFEPGEFIIRAGNRELKTEIK